MSGAKKQGSRLVQPGAKRFALGCFAFHARSLRRHQARHPELEERFRLFDLLAPTMPRVCINRVRLAIGYGDLNQRPVPSLGSDLVNPLHLAEQSSANQTRSRAS